MTPRRLVLTLDPQVNRVTVLGQPLRLQHRWEAAFLSELIAGQHHSEDSACTAWQMQQRLARRGQRGGLHRRQWGRLIEQLQHELARVSALTGWPGNLASRLRHPLRGKTVGPWWWLAQDSDQIHIARDEAQPPAPADGPTDPAPASEADPVGLHSDPMDAQVLLLSRNLLVASALRWESAHSDAQSIWADDTLWCDARPELDALRRLRLAESLAEVRRFDDAQATLADLQRRMGQAEARWHGLFGHPLMAFAQRMQYARNPRRHYAGLLASPDPGLRSQRPAGDVNPHAMAERHNLMGLCERRWVEDNAATAPPDALAQHCQRSLRQSHAALFYSLLAGHFEMAQLVSANLGYAHQIFLRTAGREDRLNHLELALGWYALSHSWVERFGVASNSVWESIFLGELWLDVPEARLRLERVDLRSTWQNRHPSTPDYYQGGCQRALELGDTRQLAYTTVNLVRFHAITGLPDADSVRSLALLALARTQQDADLTALLRAEGLLHWLTQFREAPSRDAVPG